MFRHGLQRLNVLKTRVNFLSSTSTAAQNAVISRNPTTELASKEGIPKKRLFPYPRMNLFIGSKMLGENLIKNDESVISVSDSLTVKYLVPKEDLERRNQNVDQLFLRFVDMSIGVPLYTFKNPVIMPTMPLTLTNNAGAKEEFLYERVHIKANSIKYNGLYQYHLIDKSKKNQSGKELILAVSNKFRVTDAVSKVRRSTSSRVRKNKPNTSVDRVGTRDLQPKDGDEEHKANNNNKRMTKFEPLTTIPEPTEMILVHDRGQIETQDSDFLNTENNKMKVNDSLMVLCTLPPAYVAKDEKATFVWQIVKVNSENPILPLAIKPTETGNCDFIYRAKQAGEYYLQVIASEQGTHTVVAKSQFFNVVE